MADQSPHPHVGEALRLARLLRGPLGPAAVEEVLAIARPHMGRAASWDATEQVRLQPALPRDRLLTLVGDVLLHIHVPALADRFAAVMRDEATGPDAVALAEAFIALRDAVRRTLPVADVGQPSRLVVEAIGDRAQRSTDALATALQGSDFPDVTALSFDLLRLEALRWVADILAERRAATELGRLSRRVARITLTRAAATLNSFVETRDLMTLFDTGGVISQVDNLVVVVLRILDAMAAGEEEQTAFVETEDEIALAAFVGALSRLSDALFSLVGRTVAKPDGAVFYGALLRQIECLQRLLRHIDHARAPVPLRVLESSVDDRLDRLTWQLLDALDDAIGNDLPHGPTVLSRAEALLAAMEKTGRGVTVEPLRRRIRMARRALGTGD